MSMFFGRNNNNGNTINVNTRLYTSYSDTAMVTVSAWNDKISIKIQPCVGKDANEVRQYTQEKNQIVTTSLVPENALTLLDGIDKKLIPSINSKTQCSVSVSTSTIGTDERKVLTLYYDGKDSYLILHTNIGADGKADPNNIIKHKFNKRSWLENYDSETGSGEEYEYESDLMNFIDKIRGIHLLSGIIPHTNKYDNALKSTFGRNTNNRTGSQDNNENNDYTAPTSNFNGVDMGDFLPFQ